MDPGILSILRFLGPSRDVPCQGSLWILEYLVSKEISYGILRDLAVGLVYWHEHFHQ